MFVVCVDGAALEGGGPLRGPPLVGVSVHGGLAVDAAVVEAGGGRAGRLRGGSQLTCRRSANWSERHECQM